MQKPFRFIIIATLTLLFNLGFYHPFQVNAQSSLQSQVSINLIQDSKTHYDAGRFSEAVEILEQAIAQYKTTNNPVKQAQALSFASLAYQKLGRWEEADQAITESFASLDLITQEHENPQFWQIYAQVWNAFGQLNLAKGNAEVAHESWQNAAKFYARAGDEIGQLGSQMNQTQALQSLGFYRRAEQELTELEQQIWQLSDPMLKAIALHSLGNLRRKAGELNQAKRLLQQGLAIVQPLQLPKVESQLWLSLGNVEYTLSQRATELNNRIEAEQAIQNALTHYQQAATIAPSLLIQVQAQLNQLNLFIDTKQYHTAQTLTKQVLPTLQSLPASRASVYASVNLAQSLLKLEQVNVSFLKVKQSSAKPSLETIQQLLTNAIQQAHRLDDQRAESYAAGMLGQLAEQQQNWTEAQRYTRQALQLAQVTITPDLIYQWQWQMGRLLQAQTENQSGDRQANREAVAYYTEALQVLNDLRSDLLALNPDVQFSFRERVEPIYRQLVDLLLRDEQPSKENLIQARNVIEALQLAELDNFFRDACAQPEAINVDDLDPTAAVIYPILLDDRLEIILKLPGDENLHRVTHRSTTAQQVDEVVEQLQQLLRRQSTSPGQIKQASAPLYDWLIRPFETELEAGATHEQSQIKTLVFVLDGSLRNIPPAVLFNGQQYLVERYAIAITPGLQLLDPKPLPRETLQVLVAGTTNAPSFQNEGFAPIDNVEIELTEVSKQVSQTQKLKDQDFLKETIQSKVKSNPFNIVHIATHGKFSSNPEQTFILDWNKRVTIKDLDVLLRTRETNETNPIELLILSACETASGDKRAALGLAGVAIRAGARSTLATLFQVNDASTAELMVRFYQLLKNPQLTKAEALRQAQLSFIKGQGWIAGEENSTTDTIRTNTQLARPYFWSPFILVGNWL